MKTLLLFCLAGLCAMFSMGTTFAQAPNISYTTPPAYSVGTTITPLQPSNSGGAVPATVYGTVSTFAGSTNNTAGSTNNTGTAAKFNQPNGLTINSAGVMFIADYNNNQIRKITAAGVVTLLAGGTNASTNADYVNGTTTAARFDGPSDITINPATGIMYVADYYNYNIRQVTAAGVVTTIAGSATNQGLTNGSGTAARFKHPEGIIFDPVSGTLYVADYTGNQIRQVTLAGAVTLFAGDAAGNAGIGNGTGSGASFNRPSSLAVDGSGNVYVADAGNNQIRKITPAGVVTLFAGNPTGATGQADGTGTAASFNTPYGITIDNSGNLYVSDGNNNTIRRISPAGAVTTVAGDGNLGYVDDVGTSAEFYTPWGLHVDPTNGNIIVTDFDNNDIRKIIGTGYSISPSTLPAGLAFDPTTGKISGMPTAAFPSTIYTITAFNVTGSSSANVTLSVVQNAPAIIYPTPNSYPVGTAIATLSPTNTGGLIGTFTFGTGSQFTGGGLTSPLGMFTDASGNTYVSDFGNARIRVWNSSGAYVAPTLTGNLTAPVGIVFDSSGNFYVSDNNTGRIYKFDPSGTTRTSFLTGVNTARGIAIDASDNLYVVYPATNNVIKYSTLTGNTLLTLSTNLNSPSAVAVDVAGNIYVTNKNGNNVIKYNSTGTTSTVFTSGLSGPWAVDTDSSGNVYVTDSGNNMVRIYSSTGTPLTTITGFNDPRGIEVDKQNNLYVSDYGAGTVTKYTQYNGYRLTGGALPPGLSFNSSTGSITGTPTASFPATTYTVTGFSYGLSASTTVTISTYQTIDWIGAITGGDWNLSTNWSTNTVPISADHVQIGVTRPFTYEPFVKTAAAVAGQIVIGNSGGPGGAVAITVNPTYSLTVGGDIIEQADAQAYRNYIHTLAGAGTITANNLVINSNFSLAGHPYTSTVSSSAAHLNIGNIKLTSALNPDAYLAVFNVTGGITNVTGTIQTTNVSGSKSTVTVANGTLQLTNTAALSGLSSVAGSNVVTFNNAGAIIEYAGAAQTVYTDASITGLSTGVSYQSLIFSGSGIKTASSGNLNIAGDFTNTLTNNASNYADVTGPAVKFLGTTQALAGGSANGTVFKNVTFSGAGVKTMSGIFHVTSNGVLTMSGSLSTTVLAAGGALTLNSDAAGSAAVAAFTGPSITGNVNVQRYITGSNVYNSLASRYVERNYRIISSPVNTGTLLAGNNIIDLRYLVGLTANQGNLSNSISNIFVTGAVGGTTSAGNPSLYLYRENRAPNNSSFTSGNFIGINNITDPTLVGTSDGAGYSIPVGNGIFMFYRGNATNFTTKTSYPYPAPESTTITATGNLNQGNITVKNWYTPASPSLGQTKTTGNANVRGFNMVGNPYASSIDWDTFNGYNGTSGITATDVFPTVYVFDPVTAHYSTYITNSNPALRVGTGNATHIIASGQGFLIQADTLAAASLTFTENAKVPLAQPTGATLLMGMPKDQSVANNELLRLKLSIDSLNHDDIVIGFSPNASSRYNNVEDSKYLPGINAPEGISSYSADGIPLAINFVPLPRKTDEIINLNVGATSSGTLKLSKTELDQLPNIYEVWLMDRHKRDSLDLRNNSSYTFEIDKGDTTSFGANRFQVIIRQNKAYALHLLDFAAVKAANGVPVTWKTENEENYTNFTVERSTDNGVTFDVLGGFASNSQGSYNFLDASPVNKVDLYRLKMEDLNGTISYSKTIMISYVSQSAATAGTGINVYPNPSNGMLNLAINQPTVISNLPGLQNINLSPSQPAAAAPSYAIKIINVTGSVIQSATSTTPNWQTNVSNLLPGTYVIQVVNNNDSSLVGKSTFIKL